MVDHKKKGAKSAKIRTKSSPSKRHRVPGKGAKTPLLWLSVAASVMVVIVLIAYSRSKQKGQGPSSAEIARVVKIEGTVSLLRNGTPLTVGTNASLFDGDQVVSKTGGHADIMYPDGTQVTLREGSAMTLQSAMDGGIRISLDQGKLQADVAIRRDASAVTVTTTLATAKVLGTVFEVHAQPGKTRLQVDRGRVWFERRSDATSVIVSQGEYAIVAKGEALVAMSSSASSIPVAPPVISNFFTLVDAESGEAIEQFDPIPKDAVIDMSKLPTSKLNIEVKAPMEGVQGMLSTVEGPVDYFHNFKDRKRFAIYRPFTIFGDQLASGGGHNIWSPANGAHTLTAEFFDNERQEGKPIKVLKLHFKVINASVPPQLIETKPNR